MLPALKLEKFSADFQVDLAAECFEYVSGARKSLNSFTTFRDALVGIVGQRKDITKSLVEF